MSALNVSIKLIPLAALIAGCSHSQRTRYVAPYRERTYVTQTEAPEYHTQFRARPMYGEPVPPPPRRIAVARNNDARYDISLDEIRRHQREGSAVIVDARNPDSFAQGHLRGAMNLPAGQREANIARMHQEVAPEQLVIIYCGSASCDASDKVYEYLANEGYTNLRVYKPGWDRLAMADVDRDRGAEHG